ncbi:MAG: AbrB/MazE/SpoVT family DNA-binding domain-containing protein [Planctomycetota bacterium]
MSAMTLSPDYQITFPEELRKDKRFPPGMKFDVLVYDGRISLIPIRPMCEMRGRFKLLDSEIERDEEERL